MAPLKVIGAGYGRTGTDSLRTALNILGYRTHHMRELMLTDKDRHPEVFHDAYLHPDKPVDWDLLYEDFDAAVDWPTVSFVDRLINVYPDAKVVLTARDADSWYRSVKNTLHSLTIANSGRELPEYLERIRAMGKAILLDGALMDPERFKDEEAVKAQYNAHVEWVKTNVPADRLFVMELGEGWDRLCAFLGKPVPDVPYPSANGTKDFREEFIESGFHKQIEQAKAVSAPAAPQS